jgi:hypothetical protein
MELSTRDYPNFLALQRVVAEKDRLTIYYKDLFGEWQTQYDYHELSDSVYRGKYTNRGFKRLGWWTLLIALGVPAFGLIIFPGLRGSIILQYFSMGGFGLAILFFLLAFFLKQKYIAFYQTDLEHGFTLIVNSENRNQAVKIAELIKSQIVASSRKQKKDKTGGK